MSTPVSRMTWWHTVRRWSNAPTGPQYRVQVTREEYKAASSTTRYYERQHGPDCWRILYRAMADKEDYPLLAQGLHGMSRITNADKVCQEVDIYGPKGKLP